MDRRARVLVALIGIGVLGASAACRSSADPVSAPASSTHQVTYLVQGTGRIAFDVNVGYTAANGSSGSATTSGPEPLWSTQVTTATKVTYVTLTASASGGSAESTVRCNIVVDGIQVANQSAQYSCNVQFELDKLAALRSAQPSTASASPLVTQSVPPAPPPAAPSPAAGCGYVTDDEVLAAVKDRFTAMNPSVSSQGDATSCHYRVAGDYGSDGYISLAWAKGAKVDAQTKRDWLPVPGLGVPAYATPAGDAKIQAPRGVLTLSIFGQMGWEQFVATLIALYKAAAPRLR